MSTGLLLTERGIEMQKQENAREVLWMVGAIMLFGSAVLMVIGWLGLVLMPVLFWTLAVGALLFAAAWMWGALTPERTVEITSHEKRVDDEDMDLPKAA